MKAVDIPTKFPIPFAKNAGASYIRPIPEASQIGIDDGAASLTDGFPPDTFSPLTAGGIPPDGKDFNGLLKQVTQWVQWQSAGGPVGYDASFSASNGGYPKGALLTRAGQLGCYWISTIDDNTSNPDMSGANWLAFTPLNLYAVDVGSANAIVITLPFDPLSASVLTGYSIRIRKVNTANTGATNVKIGSLSAIPLLHADGSPMNTGELPASGLIDVAYDGTNVILLSSTSTKNPKLYQYVNTTPGGFTFTVPANVYSIKVTMTGAGGGAAGSSAKLVGGSGAGGETIIGDLAVTPGQVIAGNIGARGAPGAGAANGYAGGDSVFLSDGVGGWVLTAGGGGFGVNSGGSVAGGFPGGTIVPNFHCIGGGYGIDGCYLATTAINHKSAVFSGVVSQTNTAYHTLTAGVTLDCVGETEIDLSLIVLNGDGSGDHPIQIKILKDGVALAQWPPSGTLGFNVLHNSYVTFDFKVIETATGSHVYSVEWANTTSSAALTAQGRLRVDSFSNNLGAWAHGGGSWWGSGPRAAAGAGIDGNLPGVGGSSAYACTGDAIGGSGGTGAIVIEWATAG